MNCPKCTSSMEKITFKNITVDRCTSCNGIWFPGTSHKELKNLSGSESIDTGSEEVGRIYDKMSYAFCPACGEAMSRLSDQFQPHIHYDVCPAHDGFFFDAGEFRDFKEESLMDFFKSLAWKFKREKNVDGGP